MNQHFAFFLFFFKRKVIIEEKGKETISFSPKEKTKQNKYIKPNTILTLRLSKGSEHASYSRKLI